MARVVKCSYFAIIVHMGSEVAHWFIAEVLLWIRSCFRLESCVQENVASQNL